MDNFNAPHKPNPPLILALEASGEHVSAALARGDEILAECRLDQPHGHASHIVSLASACFEGTQTCFADLAIISAGIGPGSFTGLRVALSAAKGFILAGDLIGIGINGLRARALAAQDLFPDAASFLATADTRRGVLFCQAFTANLCPDGAIFEEALATLTHAASDQIVCLPPMQNMQETLDLSAINGAKNTSIVPMSARHIARLAYHDYQAHQTDGTALTPLDPLYVAAPKLGPSKKPPQDKIVAK